VGNKKPLGGYDIKPKFLAKTVMVKKFGGQQKDVGWLRTTNCHGQEVWWATKRRWVATNYNKTFFKINT